MISKKTAVFQIDETWERVKHIPSLGIEVFRKDFLLVGFKGNNQSKPAFRFRFHDETGLQKHIEHFIEAEQQRDERIKASFFRLSLGFTPPRRGRLLASLASGLH